MYFAHLDLYIFCVQEDIISIWNKTASDQATTARIRDTLRRVLNLPPNTIMEYKTHTDSIKYVCLPIFIFSLKSLFFIQNNKYSQSFGFFWGNGQKVKVIPTCQTMLYVSSLHFEQFAVLRPN